jgi:ATP-dependent DNA helicase RecQ
LSTLDRAVDTLNRVFGYADFRGSQAEIVCHVADGGDALVLMPTGGGKSLCFQIPALMRDGTAIVVSPLIALMQDQVDALRELGIAAAALNSAQSASEQSNTENALRRGQLKLLYVSPERLVLERTLKLLEQSPLALFAIDEAHCVSQWGHDFRPEYQQLDVLADRFAQVPRIALTATADSATREEIRLRLKLDRARPFVASFDRPNLKLCVQPKERPLDQLLGFLDRHRGESGIVYALSRKSVDETCERLRAEGYPALKYHAGMDSAERAVNQRRFVTEPAALMVATVAFGMGIDKPDVRFVAHLDLPKSIEGYYQEIGRAGRDGEPAEAWLVYGLSDIVQLRRFIDESQAPDARKRYERGQLDALLGFVESADCRRIGLLKHFGETYPRPCGNCDNCLEPRPTIDASVAAQKLLSTIVRTGQRFGAMHVIAVLRGEKTAAMSQWGHDQLPVYGIGGDQAALFWRALLRQLIARNVIAVDHAGYGALKLTEAARPILRGEVKVWTAEATAPARKRKRGGSPVPAPIAAGAGQRAFDALKAWRATVARELNVPPYVIFHDSVLRAVATTRPESLGALRQIAGIGDAKLARYGETLLATLRGLAPTSAT